MNKLSLRRGVLFLSFGLLMLGAGSLVQVQAAGSFKNLQVLPKDIDKAKLKKIMKEQSKALGVECEHCHTQPNMDAETDTKKIGREMMLLTDAINAGTLKEGDKSGSKDTVKAREYYKKHFAGKKDLTCNSCHKGQKEPPEK
jgi:hypothetical protein